MSENDQEQQLFRGSASPVVNFGTFAVCGFVAAASFVGAFLVPPPYGYVLGGLGAIAVLVALTRWLLIKVRVYEVTSERIRVTDGLFTRRTDDLELYRVKDITLLEPVALRLFSVGHLEIATNDASTPLVRLEAIRGAKALREELRKCVEICRDKKRVRLAELE